jgi:hypothetical protein
MATTEHKQGSQVQQHTGQRTHLAGDILIGNNADGGAAAIIYEIAYEITNTNAT